MSNKTRESFAVCHKELRFSSDISLRLIEWLELLRILGVSKVFFHLLSVHKNMERVLNYYKKKLYILLKTKSMKVLKFILFPLFSYHRGLLNGVRLHFLENSQTLNHFMRVTAN